MTIGKFNCMNYLFCDRSVVVVLLFLSILLSSCREGETRSDVTVGERIFDEANLLSAIQEDSLFAIISKVQTDFMAEIAIVTIETLDGESIEEIANKRINEMHLGREEVKDGLLIAVALKESKMRIEVGSGLGNIVTDEVAAAIMRNYMIPKFKDKKFYTGIFAGLKKIEHKIGEDSDLLRGQ